MSALALLEAIGLTKEELAKQVADRIVNQLTKRIAHDPDEDCENEMETANKTNAKRAGLY